MLGGLDVQQLGLAVVDAGLQPAVVDLDLFLLLSLCPFVHPSLCFTGLGYIFSVRASNWYVCIQINLKSSGMLIHWQSGTRGTYEYAAAALNSPCHINSRLGRHALKKHTQSLYWFYFRPSVHPSICPSVFIACILPLIKYNYIDYGGRNDNNKRKDI